MKNPRKRNENNEDAIKQKNQTNKKDPTYNRIEIRIFHRDLWVLRDVVLAFELLVLLKVLTGVNRP